MNMKLFCWALLAVFLMPMAGHAQGMASFTLGGNGVPCTGSNISFQYPSPTGVVGGGVFPSVPFTIRAASVSALTDDPYSVLMVGQLGAGGDALAPYLIGKGTSTNVFATGTYIANSATLLDRIDVNAVCGPGHWMQAWAIIWYTIP